MAAGLGGDQVEGRNAVRELLIAGRRRVSELFVSADPGDSAIVAEIVDLARESRVTVTEVSRRRLDQVAASSSPQGVVAHAEPLKAVELEDLLDDESPFLLMADGVTDPGNLGAMLRAAECAGVTGVILPRHRAARVTPTVAKAAAGAIEHLRIAQVGGIPAAMQRLEEKRVWTVGLDGRATTSIYDLAVATEPVALVLGAEGEGLSRLVAERCNQLVSIPLAGRTESLNVSTATAVACFEVVRRRR